MINYTCKKCGHSETGKYASKDWCFKCEDLTMEKEVLDLTLTETSYGRIHPINCPKGCAPLNFGHASDVNFGDISMDVVIIYCPVCRYEHDVFTK